MQRVIIQLDSATLGQALLLTGTPQSIQRHGVLEKHSPDDI